LVLIEVISVFKVVFWSVVSSGGRRRKHVFQAGKTCSSSKIVWKSEETKALFGDCAAVSEEARGVAMSEEASFELGTWGNYKVRVEMPQPATPIFSHPVELEVSLLLFNALCLRP
jgi:3-oxoacyl-[acyl-carrier-protein] synthase III